MNHDSTIAKCGARSAYWRALVGAACLSAVGVSARAQDDELAFTAWIKPTVGSSFDFKLQNDSRERITGMTVVMDGSLRKFAYLYTGSVTRSPRVLEPEYLASEQGLVREVWHNISGTAVSSLTGNSRYPNSPDSRNMMTDIFETPSDVGDNYGQRVHGFLVAPVTGSYRFWISGDDNCQLFISGENNPSSSTLICSVPGHTGQREWYKYYHWPRAGVLRQESAPVYLVKDSYYLLTAFMKEGGGRDNLAVGWERPLSGGGTRFERPLPAHHFRVRYGETMLATVDPATDGVQESDTIRMLDISNLGRGGVIDFKGAFTTPHPANAAKLMWNTGSGHQNAKITVFGEFGGRGELTLPDTMSNEKEMTYVFTSAKRPRTLQVKSRAQGDAAGVVPYFAVRVYNKSGALIEEYDNPATDVTISHLTDGMRVEIAAKDNVYLGEAGDYLFSGSADGDENPLNPPRQRYVPTGLSINNVPQTGDPTQYVFNMNGDTEVSIRWRQDFALLIDHDFGLTESEERDATGNPWAGPLTSKAAGNPVPDSTCIHWIPKGDPVIAQVDGQVLDFSRPGLDIRYVPKSYRARGAARGVYLEPDERETEFAVGQAPPQRQQVDSFVMKGWGSIQYVWQIQYGIRVNVDDPARSALPRVYLTDVPGSQPREIGSLEGTFWFNPRDAVTVAAAANEAMDPTSQALSGWISGDGFYFSASGQINNQDGTLSEGGPSEDSTGPVALWQSSFFDGNGRRYRGLWIPSLRRPGRVLWTYGAQVFEDTARIGEHVFQNAEALLTAYPELAQTVLNEPDSIKMLSVTAGNPNVADSDMAVWDPHARRLYPLVPGQFRATWSLADGGAMHVLVTVLRPQKPHYPHIATSPAVQLTPAADGNFLFRALKYTDNEATISEGSLFRAERPGISVLLFAEIKQIGRGEPREYLRVRMVETRSWDDPQHEPAVAVIGRPIADPDLDLAGLGTGYVKFPMARYNARIYDAEKLDGLRSAEVYDMARLRSTAADKVVVSPEALPGPVIPVNLHPGASLDRRIVVTWYYDPALTDEILWPHAARAYMPRWPVDEAEGLGRIVMASQFGSDSVSAGGAEQMVAPAVTNWAPDGAGGYQAEVVPVATTYNPTRIEQPLVYVQNNPSLPGYNPNEEHGLMAASKRFARVSPRPPAAYALRWNDLNRYNAASLTEAGQPTDYTSHPYVLVQYFDTALDAFRMRVYCVVKEDPARSGYRFANQGMVRAPEGQSEVATTTHALAAEPHVVMEAGEPVIPFYPLGVVIGASPTPESYGVNIKSQVAYWEDHKGTSWSISGGEKAWFTFSVHYPMAPDFWWPPNEAGRVRYDAETGIKRAALPTIGDSVAFLPDNIAALRAVAPGAVVAEAIESQAQPVRVLYKSEWPTTAPTLKAGETLTYAGGEYRQDHPTQRIADSDGNLQTVPTPGLPGVLGFAVGEVVFDMLNPRGETDLLTQSWTVRLGQALDTRTQTLPIGSFPTPLLPASGRTRVSGGKYVFNDLPASLQRRFRYDPLAQSVDPVSGLTVSGRLEIAGRVNDKDMGDSTLTAAPPPVYVLEPNIMTAADRDALLALADEGETAWRSAVLKLYDRTRNPQELRNAAGETIRNQYLVGLQPAVQRDPVTGQPLLTPIEPGSDVLVPLTDPQTPEPARQFGPGLALIPGAGFLDPYGTIPNPDGSTTPYPDESWITLAENNDPSMGGSPVTLHVIRVARNERYRGAIKTVLSDNVFDENVVLRHTGDFGAHADDLVFEWWTRPDDGRLDVLPPYVVDADAAGSWQLFPDLSGRQGRGRQEVLLKGNPNAPETLLADSWWFVRYRHKNDPALTPNWQPDVLYEWAGAANNDPFNDFDLNGYVDYRAQLAMGWIKRVLDAVNPYEARIRDFEGDSPATASSMIRQLGPGFEGPVALNPDKDVVENVGLIQLYETILKRARDLSIDLSSPVSSPAIANALQLASTRLSDFYTLLANEAYADARDPTIGIGSDSVEYGALAPTVFSFQNQASSLIEEELALLRGADDYLARPVYNRLFWNFTKGEGEAAYAVNYNVSDVSGDGFIDEADAMILYPQGHGDAWGHYLTALRRPYDLLRHPYFNWVSRSEFYNLMDVVVKVDFLDERKFAQTAAAKARVGAEIVTATYRARYVEDPTAQWQGYGDVNPDRAWGVEDWARRAGQGAYFDWVVANALLPSQHPNTTLEGIQKVDRQSNDDIKVISANLNAVQQTFDDANSGLNPLRLSAQSVPFDINPDSLGDLLYGRSYFEQMYDRAEAALNNARAVWDNANASQNRLRQVANDEAEFRSMVFEQDLAYRNRLIEIFGRPYDGTVGPGKLYPAGYDGPDLALYMYVNVREINNQTVPGPTRSFASFNSGGTLTGGDLYDAYNSEGLSLSSVGAEMRSLFSPSFAPDADGDTPILARDGYFAVNYTDLTDPKVPLENFVQTMPIKASGYTFQAPTVWGARPAVGELQALIGEMIQQEASVAAAIGAWDALTGEIVRAMRLANAQMMTSQEIRDRNALFVRISYSVGNAIKGLNGVIDIFEDLKETTTTFLDSSVESLPKTLPTGGLAISPGDALAPVRGGLGFAGVGVQGGISSAQAVMRALVLAQEIAFDIYGKEVELANDSAERTQARRELLKSVEDLVGDEPVLRIAVFREVEALRALSDRYRSLVAEGSRLIDERSAFNKRVAAMTQSRRYQDMTFRVHRNHALEVYNAMFDLAGRYVYLAAKAYDYETNFDSSDAASPSSLFADIVRARTLGLIEDGVPQPGEGGLADALARLRINYDALKGQLGFNNPQTETGKLSLRTELFRILPSGSVQPEGDDQFPGGGADSDALWRQTLQNARVANLWEVPEYRIYARPFASDIDGNGDAAVEPGIVVRFGTSIIAGRNVFGRPLGGGDHAYDSSLFATKIRSVGVWFSNYRTDDVLDDLPEAPRVYLIPVGSDVMSIANSATPDKVRIWNVVDQQVPVPLPSVTAALDRSAFRPLLDSLNGRIGTPRRYSSFRAYHDAGSSLDPDEVVLDSRLVGRSVWNTEWLLIIPGLTLNSDADEGLDRFVEQVKDIKLIFQTYGHSGN